MFAYYWRLTHIIDQLMEDNSISSFTVVDKVCKRSRGGSFVQFKHPQGISSVELYGASCFDLEVGGKIELYHNRTYDFFYVPESETYNRYLIGLLLVFALSFLPWNKW